MDSRRLALFVAGIVVGLLGAGVSPALASADPHPGSPHSHNVPPAASADVSGGSTFTPLSPSRVLDTRDGTGTGGAVRPVGENSSISIDLSAVVPATATAVVFNLTATDVTGPTSITAWPDGATMPLSSNLNLVPGDTRPNLVTVAVGANRRIDLYNHVGTVDLIADLAGYYATGTGSTFTSLSPSRVLDTRDGTGTGGAVRPVGGNSTIALDLSAVLPATATAVVFNLTGTNTTAGTNVTAWPDGTPRPVSSNLNLAAGQTAPNLVTVAVGANRRIDLYNHVGTVDLIADLAGYYATDKGNPFYTLTPKRALDTRDANGNSVAPLGPNQTRTLDLSNWLPATATATVFNLTGTNTTASTNVTAYPFGSPQPSSSNLNLSPGQTAPNLTIVALGDGGKVSFYNHVGTVDVIADLAGYFAPAPAACTKGCVYAMGDNAFGQLANGTTGGGTTTPTAIRGLSGVTAVTSGWLNGYALKSDGTVWSWGFNDVQELGNGKASGYSTVPVPVSALDGGVVAIAGNVGTTYALKSNGTVWAWGLNSDGQLGNGTRNTSNIPVQVSGLTGVTAIASASDTGYALKSDGTVWSWGYNGFGELGSGNNSRNDALAPVQVSGLSGVTGIGGIRTGGFAVKSDGTVWSWGYNGVGGLGTTAVDTSTSSGYSTVPVQVMGLTGVKSVASGSSFTGYAVKTDGTVWAWGDNLSGTFGNGTHGGFSTNAVQVSGLTGVTTMSAGSVGTMAVKADGTVWTWGGGQYLPSALSGVGPAGGVATGSDHSLVLVPNP